MQLSTVESFHHRLARPDCGAVESGARQSVSTGACGEVELPISCLKWGSLRPQSQTTRTRDSVEETTGKPKGTPKPREGRL